MTWSPRLRPLRHSSQNSSSLTVVSTLIDAGITMRTDGGGERERDTWGASTSRDKTGHDVAPRENTIRAWCTRRLRPDHSWARCTASRVAVSQSSRAPQCCARDVHARCGRLASLRCAWSRAIRRATDAMRLLFTTMECSKLHCEVANRFSQSVHL